MTLWRMLLKEMIHRKLNFAMAVLAVLVAVGSLVAAQGLLEIHNRRSDEIMARLDAQARKMAGALGEEMRKATLKTEFNLLILPKDQNLKNWRSKDFALKTMPEKYVQDIANSGIITVRHFLPSLQQKTEWPEQNNRAIILVGTRGEVPNLHKNPVKPLVEQVPKGTIVLGHELHQSLGIKVGDKVQLMGKEFTVHQTQEKRGTQDEITAWIHLSEAQELLGKKGLINSILALGCLCAGPDGINRIRADIAKELPNTQVIEKGSVALARVEARTKTGRESQALIAQKKADQATLKKKGENLASILVPVIMVICAVWIAILAFSNVRDRRQEIGLLRALGFRSRQVMALFLSKSLAVGLVGGLLGIAAGFLLAGHFGQATGDGETAIAAADILGAEYLMLALLSAAALSVLAGWIPAKLAAQHDPAVILQEE